MVSRLCLQVSNKSMIAHSSQTLTQALYIEKNLVEVQLLKAPFAHEAL